jgi:hypothetical protein
MLKQPATVIATVYGASCKAAKAIQGNLGLCIRETVRVVDCADCASTPDCPVPVSRCFLQLLMNAFVAILLIGPQWCSLLGIEHYSLSPRPPVPYSREFDLEYVRDRILLETASEKASREHVVAVTVSQVQGLHHHVRRVSARGTMADG